MYSLVASLHYLIQTLMNRSILEPRGQYFNKELILHLVLSALIFHI